MKIHPTKEFKSRRELRQSDPLTSFLFIIVVEDLASLVREASKIRIFKKAIRYKSVKSFDKE